MLLLIDKIIRPNWDARNSFLMGLKNWFRALLVVHFFHNMMMVTLC